MTNREFYNAIINANLSDELTDFAVAAVEKLDKRNAARSSKPSKTAVANAPIKEAIFQFLSNAEGDTIAADIAEGVGISREKASALCRQMVEADLLTSTEVKIPKKGKVKAYRVK